MTDASVAVPEAAADRRDGAARTRRLPGAGEGKTRAGKVRLLTLDDLDKRTAAAKLAFDFRDKLLSERGGAGNIGLLRRAMIDSVAILTAAIRHAEVQWLKGEPVDMTELATLLNARRREAEKIGIDPDPRDVTGGPQSIYDHVRQAEDAEDL